MYCVVLYLRCLRSCYPNALIIDWLRRWIGEDSEQRLAVVASGVEEDLEKCIWLHGQVESAFLVVHLGELYPSGGSFVEKVMVIKLVVAYNCQRCSVYYHGFLMCVLFLCGVGLSLTRTGFAVT